MKKIYQIERQFEACIRRIIRARLFRTSVREKVGDKRILSEQQKAEINKVFSLSGRKIKYMYHEFYTQKTGNYSPYYVPDDFYYKYVDPFYNDWDAANYIDNKCMYNLLFPIMRQPHIVACRQNSFWVSAEKEIISFDEVLTLVACEERIFIKAAEESHGGKGVFCLEKDEIALNLENIIKRIDSDIVIQRGLNQYEELNKINEASVNTIRIISFCSLEGVKIYSRVLRMGIGNARVDNASSGGITCGIREDGTLKERAFDTNGKVYHKHPNSGVCFNSVKIPNIELIEEQIKKMHVLVPRFRLISWDIAIEEDGMPTLIEANLKDGELDFHQLNNGPIFGNDIELILKEIFQSKG